MINIRKYVWIGLTSARSNIAYMGEVAARTIFLAVILYIFLRLWQVTYSETGASELGGFTLAQMLWYLCMTEAIVLSEPRITNEVDRDVRTGAVAVQLIRPLSYPLYRLCTTIGERAVRFGLNIIVGSVVIWLFVGAIPFSLPGLAIFAISLPFAFVLDFVSYFLIGLGAFWMEDTSGLRLIYSRLTMILGGMLIPLELFPEAVQPFLNALPFASVVYGPARLFVEPDSTFLTSLLLRQSAAILLLGLVTAFVYSSAVKRINANGG